MTEQLKPCPFCGAHAQLFENNDKEKTCYIECMCCFVRTDDYYDKKYLITDWNRRVDSNSPVIAEAWDDALRSLVQSISKISKLIKHEI